MQHVRRIEANVVEVRVPNNGGTFYDLIFSTDTDVLTEGLFCFGQLSRPEHLVLIAANADERATAQAIDVERRTVLLRAARVTGIHDLVGPQILRYDKPSDTKPAISFADFRRRAQPATTVYQSLFDDTAEAFATAEYTVAEFQEIGGQITLVGDLEWAPV
ncbi:MAG: hypothetical protein AAGH76_11240 [Pseudomonadota bacterium]